MSALAAVGDGPKCASIEIYEEIGAWGVTAKDFKGELEALGDVAEITVDIHTPGGSVLDGLAIYNLLVQHKAAVNCKIGGFAASMGTVIAMAGNTVEMPENAFFMIHSASGAAYGGVDDMRETADVLEKMDAMICKIYVEKTGQAQDYIEALMSQDSWFTGAEAKELGFVDTITESMEAAAMAGVRDELQESFARMGLQLPTPIGQMHRDPVPEIVAIEVVEEAEVVETPETPEVVDEQEAEEAPATEESEIVEDEAPADGGIVSRVKAALLGGRGGADARAELVQLRGEYDTVSNKLTATEAKLTDARDLLLAQKDELMVMRAERTTVIDLVTECGFAPDQAASLPVPDSGEEGQTPGANIRDQYDAMTDKDEKTAFYQKHKAAILNS